MSTPAKTIVVTGAAGFVGQWLIEALRQGGNKIIALDRNPPPQDWPARDEWIMADVNLAAEYEQALRGAAVVYHLAAVTGKAPPHDYQYSNLQGTRVLLGACERAGVQKFVFMSSLAAGFADRRYYPYAESKIAAEQAVRASGLNSTIVRPAMILGEGSPIAASLKQLAVLPVIPVFGSGDVAVQPVDVMDVVRLLLGLADDTGTRGATLEIGGPDTFTIKELLARLRAQAGKDPARTVHLPLGPIRCLLALVEKPLLPVLPVTAGQLAAFANDGTAAPNANVDRLLGRDPTRRQACEPAVDKPVPQRIEEKRNDRTG